MFFYFSNDPSRTSVSYVISEKNEKQKTLQLLLITENTRHKKQKKEKD